MWLTLCGPPFQCLSTKPHGQILFRCAFPEDNLFSELSFISSSHPIFYQTHIESAKSCYVKSNLIKLDFKTEIIILAFIT